MSWGGAVVAKGRRLTLDKASVAGKERREEVVVRFLCFLFYLQPTPKVIAMTGTNL